MQNLILMLFSIIHFSVLFIFIVLNSNYTSVIIILLHSYVIQLHFLVKLAKVSCDIFQFFYKEEQEKTKTRQIFILECHCSLKPENIVEFLSF